MAAGWRAGWRKASGLAPGDSACGKSDQILEMASVWSRQDWRVDWMGGCGEEEGNQGDSTFGAREAGRRELPSDVGKTVDGAGVGLETDSEQN